MRARLVAAFVIAALSSVVSSCRETLAPTDLTAAPKVEELRPRQTMAGEWASEPGSCTRTFTASDSGGALEPTGCFLDPQSVNSITIDGQLTAAPSPRSTCCFVTTYPEAGTYGPMGGTGSMWMSLLVRLRLIEAQTQHTQVVTGTPFGSPASRVTINDVYETGSRGRAVWFERTPANVTVSCGGNPPAPPCPYHGYVAWKYRVSGTQTVTVRRMAKTLQVTVSPVGTIYEGDTVTFTARSSDNRPVTVVREWIWRDSTGTPSFVPCYSAVCRWVPPNSGIMYVYAKVGTNPFFEQASAHVDVVPLELRVHVLSDSTPANAGTVVGFTANAAPDVRPVKQLSIRSAPGLTDAVCTADTFCDALAVSSDSVTFSATINGRPKTATLFVGVEPCVTPTTGPPPAACTDPDRWDVFLNSLTASQRAAVLGLSARNRSFCRQDFAACRRWAEQGGEFPTPSDSVSYEEIAALTDAVYGELQAMASLWEQPLTAVRADALVLDVSKRASLVVPTPDNILDLIAILYDLGEIVVAGPNAERIRTLAIDAGFALLPGVPTPKVLAAAAFVSRGKATNLAALLAAARRGVLEHIKFSQRLRNLGHIGAAKITLANGKAGYIDGAYIDYINREIKIVELKSSVPSSIARGRKQVQDYVEGVKRMETWNKGGHNLKPRSMLEHPDPNQRWTITSDVETYPP
jgi:hypothetical protein